MWSVQLYARRIRAWRTITSCRAYSHRAKAEDCFRYTPSTVTSVKRLLMDVDVAHPPPLQLYH
eukprot:22759-Eustigmatos_ZCMA.PRE.1